MKSCIGKSKKYSHVVPSQSPQLFTPFMVNKNKIWAVTIGFTDITSE
jgi:hypothetical protein